MVWRERRPRAIQNWEHRRTSRLLPLFVGLSYLSLQSDLAMPGVAGPLVC